ncbi:MAG: hypothetical protein Q8Q60_04005 [Candidatus Chromulinivorax sp.]|nr:hypothetical protein [Candidatus Chromulinivorax sp.]
MFAFGMPVISGLINNLALGISRIFTGVDNNHDEQDPYFFEFDFIETTKSTQKIVKGLLNLGVKKKLKDNEGYTAADHLKAYIDEMESERGSYKKAFVELDKLYKMLK